MCAADEDCGGVRAIIRHDQVRRSVEIGRVDARIKGAEHARDFLALTIASDTGRMDRQCFLTAKGWHGIATAAWPCIDIKANGVCGIFARNRDGRSWGVQATSAAADKRAINGMERMDSLSVLEPRPFYLLGASRSV